MKYSLFAAFMCFSMMAVAQSLEPVIQSEYTPKPETAEGHPYLFEEYQPGSLIVNSVATNANIRYNVAENFLLVNVGGKEYIVKKELVNGFIIQGKKKVHQFEALNIGDKTYFVETLHGEGDIRFVRWHRKLFTKAKAGGADAYNASAGTMERFEDISKFILLVDGKINEYTKKKDDLLNLISGGNEAMKSFLTATMKEKKLKANNEEDVVELLKARDEYRKKNS